MRHCRQGNIITFLFGCNPSEEKASNFGRGVVTKLNGAFIVYRDLYKKYVYAFQREQFPPVEYRNATITLGKNFVAILRWNWKSREHWSIRVLKNSFRAQFPSGSVLSRLRDNWIVWNRLKYFYGTTFNGVPFLFFRCISSRQYVSANDVKAWWYDDRNPPIMNLFDATFSDDRLFCSSWQGLMSRDNDTKRRNYFCNSCARYPNETHLRKTGHCRSLFFMKINSIVSKIDVKIAIGFLVLRGILTKL